MEQTFFGISFLVVPRQVGLKFRKIGIRYLTLNVGKGKVCIRAKWPIRPEFIRVFVA